MVMVYIHQSTRPVLGKGNHRPAGETFNVRNSPSEVLVIPMSTSVLSSCLVSPSVYTKSLAKYKSSVLAKKQEQKSPHQTCQAFISD